MQSSEASIRLCGELRVQLNGGSVEGELPARQGRLLFAYLVLQRGRAVRRDELVEGLWPERTPRDPDAALNSVLARLRAVVGRERLPIRGPVRLQLGQQAWVDVEVARAAPADAQRAVDEGRADDALQLAGEALDIIEQPLLAEFERGWLDERRRELADLSAPLVDVAVDAALRVGGAALQRAELIARRGVDREPFRESAHAALMRVLAAKGDSAEALLVYETLRVRLRDELGSSPSRVLVALHHRLLTQQPSPLAESATVSRHSHAAASPAEDARGGAGLAMAQVAGRPLLVGRDVELARLDALFGRDRDLERLGDLVGQPHVRLLTLVGPGGVGKTRLAIEAAGRLAGGFADGARFVALGPLADPREVASAVAVALAAPLREAEPPATALLRFLADRQLLLVLDNLEHLLAGAPLVGELLANCPRLTILLTSREPTRLGAERLYPVRPLELPAASDPGPAALERVAAVALFCDRACAREPDFVLDANSAPHVRAICRRLDGLPLAIELAAARIGLLSPGELAARLNNALAVLTGGARDAPERQRTLRATIDWSYNLLTKDERCAFAQFAVFAASATVGAAETVTGAALDTLDSLVAKHLLTRRDERLLMLETVREYALERLADDPGADAARERLATYCLILAEEAGRHLVQADRVQWLATLAAELPNAQAAIFWALEADQAEQALQLVSAWAEYWWHTNLRDDGLTWIDAAFEQACDASPRARARALLQRARLTGWRRHQRHCEDLQRSLQLFRTCGDATGIADCLGLLAFANASVGHYELASSLSDEALQFAERSQDEAVLASALTKRALAAAKYEDMARAARRAVAALRRVGNLMELARVCSVTGYLAIAERRDQEALAWLDESLEAARRLENAHGVYVTLGNQGLAHLFLGDLAEAERSFSDALAMMTRDSGAAAVPGPEGRPARQLALQVDPESGEPLDETLLGLAAVTACQGEFERAARMAGAAKRHRTEGQAPQEDTIWKRLDDEILKPARERGGLDTWDCAAQQGASLSVREAIELGLARASERSTRPSSPSPSRSDLDS